MRLILFAFLIIPFTGRAQTYSDFISRAQNAIQKKDYKLSASIYDSAFARYKPNSGDLYNASCVNSLSGQLSKATQLLTKAFEKGYKLFDWMYYDKDLSAIRYEPAYLALEKKYRPDSVVFLFDILRQLGSSDDVRICDRRISLTESAISDYSFADINYRLGFELKLIGDSLIDFSNKTLEICQSRFDDDMEDYNSLQRMSLAELVIAECWGKLELVNIKLAALDFYQGSSRKNNLTRVVLDNVNLNGTVRLHAGGDEFICRNSVFNINVPRDVEYRWGLAWNLDYKQSQVLNTTFNSVQKDGPLYPFDFDFSEQQQLKIADSKFNYSTRLLGNITDVLVIRDNSFPRYVDIMRLKLPDFDCYIPFSQIRDSERVAFTYIENKYAIVGDSAEEYTTGMFYESLTALYKRLYDHYRARADVASANDVYVLMKDLEILHLKSIEHRTTEETLRLRLNQLMGFYTDHATSPGKAIIISFYIVLAFALFYCFFPSDWDRTSKAQVVSDFRTFIEKNEHGYIMPFLKMMRGLLISLLNAVALSMNAFITLGFGNIPTTGSARYVCILQGLVGWFLLSLFTVALLNQVLL
jgi:hypothetical protein